MRSRPTEARGVVIAVACLFFAAAALVLWSLLRTNNAPANEPDTPRIDLPTPPPDAVEPAKAPVARPDPAAKPKLLRLPDGSEVAPLNGVTEPAAMTWGEGPFSPIVGKIHGNGFDWYVHGDGTHTTTIEVWRHELGRLDPVTLVYRSGGVPAAADPGK